eukprot:SAG31_NODE_792_length_12047_cov_14.428607_5_plen_534_part_00
MDGGSRDAQLHAASEHRMSELALRLLALGADANAVDPSGSTALHKAATGGEPRVVHRMVQLGANVTARAKNGSTPLHCAAAAGHAEVVRLLIARGADANAAARNGQRPLHTAATAGHEDAIAALMEHRANVAATDNVKDTAVHKAAEHGHVGALEQLLQVETASATSLDKFRGTPLHRAAEHGHCTAMKLLLLYGAEPDSTDWYQRTALHRAARNGHRNAAELLCDFGATVAAVDFHRFTPLSRAVEHGHLGLAVALLQRVCSLREDSSSASMRQGDELRQRKPQTNLGQEGIFGFEERSQYTAMQCALYAVWQSQPQLLALCLQAGYTALDTVDRRGGFTVLHEAVSHGACEATVMLLQRGADPNVPDAIGMTALHRAVQQGHIALAELLLEKGADPSIRTHDGLAAVDIGTSETREAVGSLVAEQPLRLIAAYQRLCWAASLIRGMKAARLELWRILPASGELHRLIGDHIGRRARSSLRKDAYGRFCDQGFVWGDTVSYTRPRGRGLLVQGNTTDPEFVPLTKRAKLLNC